MFKNHYKNKKVLITGHTGFKGSWLTAWLLECGANVVGVSIDIPSNPSMFEVLELNSKTKNYFEDVRDLDKLSNIINAEQPDYIFHLAAQAIVSISKINPIETMSTNVIGTMNLLEVLRNYSRECVVVFITSDKCYDNVEWVWGYRETDPLGGKDIYSGSKAAAELVIKSYVNTYFNQNHPVKIGIGRAGNVIGGGDWAKDRIIVDAILAWSKNEAVSIRAPKSTRPWQHVLEPLSGYLHLGSSLKINPELHGEAYNFGPSSEQNKSVKELILDISIGWNLSNENIYNLIESNNFKESKLLKLNCDKALYDLNWESNLEYQETAKSVSEWYREFYLIKSKSMYDFTVNQINIYCQRALSRNKIWTKK